MKPPSKYKTLDHLLSDYKQNGVDSEGQFTLNPVRARELLKQFQLPEVAHYLLHLVSFLVGAGATGISIMAARSVLRIEAPGAQIPEEAMKSPFGVLLQSNAEPYLSELALALNALLGASGGSLELNYGKVAAKYTADKIAISSQSPSELLTVFIKPRVGDKDRELELVREAFFWCPIPIEINGLSILQPNLSGPQEGLEIHLHNESYPLLLSSYSGNRIVKPTPASFSASIRIHRGASGLRVLSLGRAYPKPLPWSYFVPGWQLDVTINTDQFKKDLSQQDILENEKYKNLLGALRVQLDHATELMLRQVPPLAGTERLAEDIVETFYTGGSPQVALDYQSRLVQSLGLTSQSLDKGRAIYRLGLLENALNPSTLSQNIRLGFEMMQATAERTPLEPRWSILKGQMAFTPEEPKLSQQVKDLLDRADLTLEKKEHCYRWLLRQGKEGPRIRVGYRVDLARQAFEMGRFDEALAHLEAARSGPEGRELVENKDFAISAAELEGEIAARSGQVEKSLEMFGKQLVLLRERHGQYSLELGLTLERLALLLEFAGQPKQAKEYRAWSQRLYE